MDILKIRNLNFFFLLLFFAGCSKNHAETVRPPDSALEFEFKIGTDKTEFASYDGESISNDQVKENTTPSEDVSTIHGAALKLAIYQSNLNRVKGIVIRRALFAAAKKENINVEDFLKKHLEIPTAVTDSQFESYLKRKNIGLADLTPQQSAAVRANATQDERDKKIDDYAVKNFLKNKIYVFEAPPTVELKISDEWQSLWGPQDAPISVIFFGDLLCSPCRSALKSLIPLEQEFRGHIKVGFNFFIPSSDRNSIMISEAALCTAEQGPKFFRKFVGAMLNQEKFDEDAIDKSVFESGAKLDSFKPCFYNRQHQKLLQQHLKYSETMGVSAPPTILINGEAVEGAINPDELRELIRRKIETQSPVWPALVRRVKYYFRN